MSHRDPRIDLLRALADPVRLRVIDRLALEGPATVSRLAAELRLPLPLLSNHLRRLREARLVRVSRSGRRAVYEIADAGLELLLPMLDAITGRVLEPRSASLPIASRTCRRHLAGPIGVGIYRALRERDAISPRADGLVDLGPAAEETFTGLGLDLVEVRTGRQLYAFECLDATERAPHLAGALGDALARVLFEARWIEEDGHDGRRIRLTPAGSRGLRRTLGLQDASMTV